MLEGKTILITGASGSIGSELYRQLAPKNTVIAFDQNESDLFGLHEEHEQKDLDVHFRIGDIRDPETVWEICNIYGKIDVIFHAAALKHVYPNELFPDEAVKTNVAGTLNIIREAKRAGIEKLVYISTDKAINAHSVMGTTKRLGELIARNAGYVAVRFGNVMRSRGSVLEIWERQIANNEPITVTDTEAERYMMTIPDACKLLIKAAEVGPQGSVLVMDMGRRVRIGDLALKVLADSGKKLGYKLIGLRPGESLVEELMTSEERKHAKKLDNFWIIS